MGTRFPLRGFVESIRALPGLVCVARFGHGLWAVHERFIRWALRGRIALPSQGVALGWLSGSGKGCARAIRGPFAGAAGTHRPTGRIALPGCARFRRGRGGDTLRYRIEASPGAGEWPWWGG
jgi:hypothetical protein